MVTMIARMILLEMMTMRELMAMMKMLKAHTAHLQAKKCWELFSFHILFKTSKHLRFDKNEF